MIPQQIQFDELIIGKLLKKMLRAIASSNQYLQKTKCAILLGQDCVNIYIYSLHWGSIRRSTIFVNGLVIFGQLMDSVVRSHDSQGRTSLPLFKMFLITMMTILSLLNFWYNIQVLYWWYTEINQCYALCWPVK